MARSSRTRPCDASQANQRMERAREFLAVAEFVGLKDKAQYGFLKMSVPEVQRVMRRAGRLIDFAAEALRR